MLSACQSSTYHCCCTSPRWSHGNSIPIHEFTHGVRHGWQEAQTMWAAFDSIYFHVRFRLSFVLAKLSFTHTYPCHVTFWTHATSLTLIKVEIGHSSDYGKNNTIHVLSSWTIEWSIMRIFCDCLPIHDAFSLTCKRVFWNSKNSSIIIASGSSDGRWVEIVRRFFGQFVTRDPNSTAM